jgi:hydrogenase maturation protein HypF
MQKPLVMTSGNRSDEPIAYRDEDAIKRLSGIADVFLFHDRPIAVRCDDSVVRAVDDVEMPIRRSRGYSPSPIALPSECPCPILAVGGQLKATFGLGRGRQAFLSHHVGDLDDYEAYRAYERDIALYQDLLAVTPRVVVHDLHPDYASTRFAQQQAARGGAAIHSVQHHHAHLASCMAENLLSGPVIGITFDGTGYGTDGAVWGGEFLVGDYCGFQRFAHFRYVGMPGGEKAIREPWRMAASYLRDACLSIAAMTAVAAPSEVRVVEQLVHTGFNTPPTSSAGRLFDAVAALAGVRGRASYEGQAAMELEWVASRAKESGSYPFELARLPDGSPWVVDTRPLIRAVVEERKKGSEAALVARRFHSTLVEIIAAVVLRIRQTIGLTDVVLSGGVFLNVLLTREATARLEREGFRVYRHRLVPPNDGGLSLGQLAVAAAQIGG